MKVLKEKRIIEKFVNDFTTSDTSTEQVYFPHKLMMSKRKQFEKIFKGKSEVFFSGAIHVIDGLASAVRLSTDGVYFSISNTDFDFFSKNSFSAIEYDGDNIYYSCYDKGTNTSVSFNCFCPKADYEELINA